MLADISHELVAQEAISNGHPNTKMVKYEQLFYVA